MTAPLEPAGSSLATWLNELGPSSPCFCCGSPLSLTVDAAAGLDFSVRLSCPCCGAGVEWDEVREVQEVLEPALVAA